MIYTLTLNPAIDRELTVTEVEFDAVLSAIKSQVDIGGKGFNVSRLLKSMGMPSTALGFIGGRTGERLRLGLEALDIATDFVSIPGETRTNISIVTEKHDHYIKVNEKGPMVDAEKQHELLDKIASVAGPGDWWVLAGSLPPGVPDSFYAEIIDVLNAHKAITILDTTGESLRLGCEAKPYLVKPNADEVQKLTDLPVDTPSQIALAAAELRKMGAQNVVISLGKKGAFLQTGGENHLVRSPKIKEKNPIGAGDSMVGGMVWGLSQGFTLKESLGWGAASGAASASMSGTEVGSRELIERLFSQVQYERLVTA
ncbi:MAG TPA: 1-phosphofructokinase [Anaerolineales bacterium]|nr:1-phosphofructokinase [Anaerolineales bacterium]